MNVFKKVSQNLSQVYDLITKELEIHSIENEKLLLEQQKDQLWDGVTKENKPIRPSHSESTFFKSPAAVEKYINWKESAKLKDLYKNRSFVRGNNTPNLYINGKFYSEIFVQANDKGILFDASGTMSRKIKPVFKNIFGLTDTNTRKFIVSFLPIIIPKIKSKILDV